MKYDVSGIGSPLLDLSLEVEEKLLQDLSLKKGSMKLVDLDQAQDILKIISGNSGSSKTYDIQKTPGGSVANVLAGVSALGGKSVLLGKIGFDEYGKIYHAETKKAGTVCKLSKHKDLDTGHAITFITPDGERTFATYLGASLHLNINDIDEDAIKSSKILHLEGFTLEDDKLRETIKHAIEIAQHNNTQVSIDLSDSELVKRNIDYLKFFVDKYVNIVFANENEAQAFTGKGEDKALEEIYKRCDLAIVKLGGRGSLIKDHQNIYKISVHNSSFINSNGAGDMYAAGVLYGLANGMPLEKAGNLASYVASLVVAKDGARVNEDLSHLPWGR